MFTKQNKEIMKKTIAGLVVVVLAIACKPDPYKEIGPTYSTAEGVDGTWSITKVEVIDESSPLRLRRDLTDFYLGATAPIGLELNVDSKTYTVQNASQGGNYFGTNGTFIFDDEDFPTQMTFIEGTDSTVVNFTQLTRKIDPYMGLSIKRSACDKLYATYQFTFSRN